MIAVEKETSWDESLRPPPLASKQEFIDAALLKKIDRLFECGVGNHVALPQLVVVGDQSSGKSSVLEGLTRLPFPRDSGLCTRFATQIIFRRDSVKNTSICLIPASNASEAHKAYLRAWSKSSVEELGTQEFLEVIEEAQEVMGLTGETDFGPAATFSEDVLKIEITGPQQQHLSIVDVPGIFRAITEGITTEADVQMVRSIVSRYMSNPRSVMLTVVPANQDVATQEILTMAKQVDPEGTRTVGILTKPDLMDPGSERGALDLLNGAKHKLALGWHVLRNPGQHQLKDSTPDARDRIEKKFFETEEPWNRVPSESRGILKLRERLQDILTIRIRHEFPKVQNEINQRLNAARQQLQNLGAKRSNTAEQRMYLTDICTEFQKIKSNALNGQYTTSQFDECPSLRLPTYVRTRNEQFDANMEEYGHLYEFVYSQTLTDNFPSRKTELSLDELTDAIQSTKAAKAEWFTDEIVRVRQPTKFPELMDCTILDKIEVEGETRPGIVEWLVHQHTSTKAWELGSVNPTLLNSLFREQAFKWDHLAKGYISDVIEMVHSFITELLKIVAADVHVRNGIMAKLIDRLVDMYQKASDHVDFLLHVEKYGVALTTNCAFADDLQAFSQGYSKAHLDDETRSAASSAAIKASGRESEIRHLHDVLNSYYDVARKRFVDNVQMQAAVHHLIFGPSSPLELFSASLVNRLSDEELEEIAGEDPSRKRRRAALEKEVGDLEAGKAILR